MDIKKYIFKKLIFPKVFVIDKPGLIYSKNFSFISHRAYNVRVVYTFEDAYVNLYFDTVKKIGVEKTNELWYKIGKDVATRYLLLNKGDFPLSKIPEAIKHFQEVFNGVGMSFLENVEYNLEKKIFIFWGENNVICRKIGNASLMAGIISGLISFILKENLEAESFCEVCPNGCKLIVRPGIETKYMPDFSKLKVDSKYYLNFYDFDKFQSNLASFSNFLKFNLVNLTDKNKFSFINQTIIPSEISLPEIFAFNYKIDNYGKIFETSIINFSYNFSKNYLSQVMDEIEQSKLFRNLISAFGFGELYLRKEGKLIKAEFLKPIFINFELIFIRSIINGFLNFFYGTNFVFIKGDNKTFWYSIK
jgi:hypothetical protein